MLVKWALDSKVIYILCVCYFTRSLQQNVKILKKSPLTAQKVVKMTILGAANDGNFVKMTPQCPGDNELFHSPDLCRLLSVDH